MKLQMIDAAGNEVLVERIFDSATDRFDAENSLIRVFQMQYRDATNASQEAADEYINAALAKDKIAFVEVSA